MGHRVDSLKQVRLNYNVLGRKPDLLQAYFDFNGMFFVIQYFRYFIQIFSRDNSTATNISLILNF
ncbi:hypothetical protein D3C73_1504060 [compost metagenome]